MSGSSLDGLDVAFCSFHQMENNVWEGQIVEAETFELPPGLKKSLDGLRNSSALELAKTDSSFARFSAECVQKIGEKAGKKPMAIASHGHTIFHQPAEGYTVQIGIGGLLAALSGLPVVSDFRTTDVGLGGQGAPLVPGAERFLFSEYDACLNLGGIANVSFPKSSPFLGFDISPCNQLLNKAAAWLHKPYDENGDLARTGILIPKFLDKLNANGFYLRTPPKSLGNEDVAQQWKPIMEEWKSEPENALYTLTHHISSQIAQAVLRHKSSGKMLVTGGGAFNGFLIESLKKEMTEAWEIVIPGHDLIAFIEAYCFAFLGLKRWLGEINCFSEVTGASKDSCAGAIYLP